MSCAFDKDIVDGLAASDLSKEIEASTDEAEDARETGLYQARECGNCHNILWLLPFEAVNQVFDGEGWINCDCGAVVIGKLYHGHWTP